AIHSKNSIQAALVDTWLHQLRSGDCRIAKWLMRQRCILGSNPDSGINFSLLVVLRVPMRINLP
ncbi:hypothetical protein L9F63_000844, partial [Diploptera punctata]